MLFGWNSLLILILGWLYQRSRERLGLVGKNLEGSRRGSFTPWVKIVLIVMIEIEGRLTTSFYIFKFFEKSYNRTHTTYAEMFYSFDWVVIEDMRGLVPIP
ncbi:hypothetical protein RclHR1_07160012 [Rhizophagus clarus]|uniref:Uncharacterized protein n=1 Tax=Rhizophagus clarus TaxID=94130 RepID=A0A2Z6RVX8_9GLOM|nr:hypothetical protein RclHR1_07160012 [Rhizophagus clarus]GES72994.1 hypothetical protein RCL_jg2058.t1 [Rhizophagus clarus]